MRKPFLILSITTLMFALFSLIPLLTKASVTTPLSLTVLTDADSGPGSLRQAILDANANPGLDTITFNAGVTSITPLSPLPDITDPLTIDGGTSKIELNGSNIPNDMGLVITGPNSAGSTIKNLVINRFLRGIVIQGASNNNKVQGCYIGTDVSGTAALGNHLDGVAIVFSNSNQIGGITAAERNVIAGNQEVGVRVVDVATNNRIEGNYIGTDVTGNNAIGNNNGIIVEISSNNVIAYNLISGNRGRGVVLTGTTTKNNSVTGNRIGTKVNGTAALGNGDSGVHLEGCEKNIIGGTLLQARNLISSNAIGVRLTSGASQNQVSGNYIGTDFTGTFDLGNVHSGVIINDSPNNLIGGSVQGAGNLVSGNDVHGVDMVGANTTGNRIEGNLVGTKADGQTALPNTREGIRIEVGSENIIGGTVNGARNIISGNNLSGVILGVGAARNQVAGNFIGTNITGTAPLPNNGYGVWLGFAGGASQNVIGGSTVGAGNLISGNNNNGIGLTNSGVTNNIIAGNYIGTDITGALALGNGNFGSGIIISNAANNIIGGAIATARNVISGHKSGGVIISGNTASGNKLIGNYIGTNAGGNIDLGNASFGISINAPSNIIGGTNIGERNLISGNNTQGVLITNTTSTGNRVVGNFIGTDITGTLNIGNSREGILLGNCSNNMIGGTGANEGNVISFNGSANGSAGILVAINSTVTNTNNQILGNSIYSNAGLGIDLSATPSPNGVTLNDALDVDTGGNSLQNFPILTAAAAGVVTGTLNSQPNTIYRLEFFTNTAKDASGYGEGEVFIGSINVTTDASGVAAFSTAILPITPGKPFISATATDANGNTSEFSACVQATFCPPSITLSDLPEGMVGFAYQQSIVASPTGSYNFNITSGLLPAGLNFSNGIISGTPTQGGTFAFTVTATTANGCIGSRNYTLAVNRIPTAIAKNQTVTAGQDCTAVVDINDSSYDPDGDTLTITQSPAGPYSIGTHVVTLRVADGRGGISTATATVIVNAAVPTPTINTPALGAIFPINTAVNFTGSFTDTIGGTHTALWNFDNIAQPGIVDVSNKTVSAAYSFTTPGVYKVKLTVNNACGGSATVDQIDGLMAMIVVYDPAGGWVTGGGWINSPAGAYTLNPSLAGKANFAFVSKYEKGATAPSGSTEFRFKAGNLNFSSTRYEWLVVAGAKAQYKGSGQINDAGNYDFRLTVIDGQLPGGGGTDKFRIQIWDRDHGGLIYDNMLNAPNNNDPTTVIGGGNIIIHP